jgi:6-phosphogluconate dehydrogenase
MMQANGRLAWWVSARWAAGSPLRGFRVIGFDKKPAEELVKRAGLSQIERLRDFARTLEPPRMVLLYLPAGPLVDDTLGQLSDVLEHGDVVADGGNSYWGDSIRRHQRLRAKGIRFADLGTSGGPGGALNGACFMVGGDADAVGMLEPVLRDLAVPGGYVHASRDRGHTRRPSR